MTLLLLLGNCKFVLLDRIISVMIFPSNSLAVLQLEEQGRWEGKPMSMAIVLAYIQKYNLLLLFLFEFDVSISALGYE